MQLLPFPAAAHVVSPTTYPYKIQCMCRPASRLLTAALPCHTCSCLQGGAVCNRLTDAPRPAAAATPCCQGTRSCCCLWSGQNQSPSGRVEPAPAQSGCITTSHPGAWVAPGPRGVCAGTMAPRLGQAAASHTQCICEAPIKVAHGLFNIPYPPWHVLVGGQNVHITYVVCQRLLTMPPQKSIRPDPGAPPVGP
jgi:hypothetical protein